MPTPSNPHPEQDKLVDVSVRGVGLHGGSFRNVIVLAWFADVEEHHFDWIESECVRLWRSYERIAVLNIYLPGSNPPPPKLRARAREFPIAHSDGFHGLGMLFEGQGFWASRLMSVATSLFSMGRKSVPTTVFRTRKQALETFSKWTGHSTIELAYTLDMVISSAQEEAAQIQSQATG